MVTACCNLEKNGGGGGRVACKYHDIYILGNWVIKSKSGNQNIAVADQEFPRWGRRSDPKEESASLLFGNFFPENCMTRIHSSRMRTARSSSCLWGGGGCLPQCMLEYTPLGLGLDTHPNTPLGVGLDTPLVSVWTPPSQTPQPPLWVWA